MPNFQFDRLGDGAPIFVTKLPREIVKELGVWERECKKIKNHPLAELKSHENVGYDPSQIKKFNSYQCTIPPRLIEDSFWLSYTIRLCSQIFGGNHRQYYLRKHPGHFDGYDIWANFAYRGNENPLHSHSGNISGVIYDKNHKHPTFFPDYDTKYEGTNGTMILFRSDVRHYVEPQKSWKERITFAFNISLY